MPRLAILAILACLLAAGDAAPTVGVPIRYTLPEGTWRVTLAITEADDPDWIVSTFVRGAERSATAANKGEFTELWDGLDENLMPVPPGRYAVKGILMPAHRWAPDGQMHTITPRFLGGPCSFLPPDDRTPVRLVGDNCGAPLGALAVTPDWSPQVVLQWGYLENGANPYVIDMAKAPGDAQIVKAFRSGGAGGGDLCCSDGETVWAFNGDGEIPYLYRTDEKPFSNGRGHVRNNVWVTPGERAGLACWREPGAADTTVFFAMGAKLKLKDGATTREPEAGRLDTVVALSGTDARELARVPLAGCIALRVHAGVLYALHSIDGGHAISALTLKRGLPEGVWKQLLRLSAMKPADFDRDSHGRFYVCDTAADQVYRLDAGGAIAQRFGKRTRQGGAYDPLSFIAPSRLACWKGADGADRVVVVEALGPNRLSEWSPEGKLLRQWNTLSGRANTGVGLDPANPRHLYLSADKGWLTRFVGDWAKGTWTVDAVWPVGGEGDQPYMAHWQGGLYLAYGVGYRIFRIDGYDCRPAGGLIQQQGKDLSWHDANGNGVVDADETAPTAWPPGCARPWWGQAWGGDLSLLAIGLGTTDVWRMKPASADARGNPVFGAWEKLLTDPVLAARAAGTATPTRGGNEVSSDFCSDWSRVQTTPGGDVYVLARGGGFSANNSTQQKLTRYVADGKGGVRAKWRVGRANLEGKPGEITGAIHLWPPVYGLVGFADQSRGGYHVYTEDGLFVDTLFLEGSRQYDSVYGIPGEFFGGQHFLNREDGKMYLAMGKTTPLLFAADGWTKDHGIQPLALKDRTVAISAAQIAFPPEIALQVRGGAGAATATRVVPATGGAPALDGGMDGWEAVLPLRMAHSGESVETRLMYDPTTIYARIEVVLDQPFAARPLAPIEGCFVHDRGATTVSLYLQGDPLAGPGAPEGRPGDVRVVFGVFDDAGKPRPVAYGLHATYAGKDARPAVYATPVGRCAFAHAGEVAGAKLSHQVSADGKRLVIAAALPRTALGLPALAGLRTTLNVETTLRGAKKFWWAGGGLGSREVNDAPSEARLYPAAWGKAEFQLPDRLVIRAWQVCGPFGGPEAKRFNWDLPGELKPECDRFFAGASYPPDGGKVDLTARFSGDLVQGYWKDPGEVRWQPRFTAISEDRVVMATAGQVWYAASWLHAPQAMTVEAQVLGHWQTTAHWLINGQPFPTESRQIAKEPPASSVQLPLQAGWNQLFVRAHCVGYPPFRFGLAVQAPPDQLWGLRPSPTPPGR